MPLASERDALIADICHLLERARRADDRAKHPPSSWGLSVRGFAYAPGDAMRIYHYAHTTRGLASPGWRADSRDYLNYLWSATEDLRRQALRALPTPSLWEILTLLSEM